MNETNVFFIKAAIGATAKQIGERICPVFYPLFPRYRNGSILSSRPNFLVNGQTLNYGERQMTASIQSAVPRCAKFRVLLALESQVKRYGLERIMASAEVARDIDIDSGGVTHLNKLGPNFDFVVVALNELSVANHAALVRGRECGAKVLLLLDVSNPCERAAAADVPADGFLDEAELTPGRLSDALACMSNGDVPMHAVLAREALTQVGNEDISVPNTLAALTPRENEVLALLVDGRTNRQIGRCLGISEHGAKRLVGKILVRLGCSSRTSAVALAIRSGSIPRADSDRSHLDSGRFAVAKSSQPLADPSVRAKGRTNAPSAQPASRAIIGVRQYGTGGSHG